MKQQAYGNYQRGKAKTAPSADRLVIDIRGRHTLEQFSLEVMKAVARLQERGAHGVEACSIYLKPLDDQGGHVALWDQKGAPVTRLAITDDPEPPPYRQDNSAHSEAK